MALASKDFVTPPELAGVTTAFLGGEISLDPASSDAANEVIQATRYFTWRENGIKQPWNGKNIYLYPPRDFADKSEQPKSTKIFEQPKYFRRSNQTVWLELAYQKWIRKEFDEGIVFLTSAEVALLRTQKLGIDLPICILKKQPKLLHDTPELTPCKYNRCLGFILYLPSVTETERRIHDFHQLYSDLGRVYA